MAGVLRQVSSQGGAARFNGGVGANRLSQRSRYGFPALGCGEPRALLRMIEKTDLDEHGGGRGAAQDIERRAGLLDPSPRSGSECAGHLIGDLASQRHRSLTGGANLVRPPRGLGIVAGAERRERDVVLDFARTKDEHLEPVLASGSDALRDGVRVQAQKQSSAALCRAARPCADGDELVGVAAKHDGKPKPGSLSLFDLRRREVRTIGGAILKESSDPPSQGQRDGLLVDPARRAGRSQVGPAVSRIQRDHHEIVRRVVARSARSRVCAGGVEEREPAQDQAGELTG